MSREIFELREVVTKLVPMLTGKGLVVTQRGSKAFVDADPVTRKPIRVNIPNIPDNADAMFVRAVQGFIDHEVGHVLITDWNWVGGYKVKAADMNSPKFERFRTYHNIMEDTMIEREMAVLFPGSKKNIGDMRRHFIEKITKPAVAGAKSDSEMFQYLLVPVMRALAGHREFAEYLDENDLWKQPLVKALVDRLPAKMKAELPKLKTTRQTHDAAKELEAVLHPSFGPPVIDKVDPEKGFTVGKELIALTGDNFIDIEWVKFGNELAKVVVYNGLKSIVVESPAHEEGLVDIGMQTSHGSVVRPSAFEYVKPPPSPGKGDGESDPEDSDDEGEKSDSDEKGDTGKPSEDEDKAEDENKEDGESQEGEGDEEKAEQEGEAEDTDVSDADAGEGDEDDASDDEPPAEDNSGEGDEDKKPDESSSDAEQEAGESDDSDGSSDDDGAESDEDAEMDSHEDESASGDETDGDGEDKGEGEADEAGEQQSGDQDGDKSEDGEGDAADGDPQESDEEGTSGESSEQQTRVAIQTDDHDAGDIGVAEDQDQSGGGGVGNGLGKSLFDFKDDAFEEADTSSQIAILIANEAVGLLSSSDYNVYTREFDRIETLKVTGALNSAWVPMIDEKVRSMTGKMSKDIERMMASQNHVIKVPGYRSGRLHAPNLHRIVTNDDRIFNRRQEHKAKNTAVTLLIDCSGSMKGRKIETAMIAGYALMSTLDRVNIPCEMIGFTTGDFSGTGSRKTVQEMQNDVNACRARGVHFHRITPISMPIFKTYDERIDAEVKKRIAWMAKVQNGMLSNIDGESLEYAAMRLLKRREKRKVMLVLSDGQPSGAMNVAEHTKYMIGKLEGFGIDLVGIGIMDASVKRFYRNNIVLNNVDDLPTQVMAELKKILVS